MSRSQTNVMTFHELEKLVIIDETTRVQCLEVGRQLAIKRSLEHFQADMEMLFLSIKKKQVNIQSLASIFDNIKLSLKFNVNYTASSKQRAHMRHSLVADKKRLESCVDKYNELCSAIEEEYHATTVENILDGDFPWSLLTGTVH